MNGKKIASIFFLGAALILLSFFGNHFFAKDIEILSVPIEEPSDADAFGQNFFSTSTTGSVSDSELRQNISLAEKDGHRFDGASPENDEEKYNLFLKKRDKIKLDRNGNYLVEISTHNFKSKEYLISDWPIFYPNETQLNEGVQGCSSGGYYVDVQATFSLLIKNRSSYQSFHFKCEFDQLSSAYLLKKYEPSASVLASISSVKRILQ